MTELRIAHYAALLGAIRARVAELNVSYECVDSIAGWAPGYASKVFAPKPIKHLSAFSMFILLQALGLQLAITPDAEALAIVQSRLRDRPARFNTQRTANAKRMILLGRDLLINRAVRGGRNSRKYMSKQQASRIARKSIRARWNRVKNGQKKQSCSNQKSVVIGASRQVDGMAQSDNRGRLRYSPRRRRSEQQSSR